MSHRTSPVTSPRRRVVRARTLPRQTASVVRLHGANVEEGLHREPGFPAHRLELPGLDVDALDSAEEADGPQLWPDETNQQRLSARRELAHEFAYVQQGPELPEALVGKKGEVPGVPPVDHRRVLLEAPASFPQPRWLEGLRGRAGALPQPVLKLDPPRA